MRHACLLISGFYGVAGLMGFLLPASAADQTVRPGSFYMSKNLQALQADDIANPGMLWVSDGEVLWGQAAGAAKKSCASCHEAADETMKGVAARYPAVDAESGELFNLEKRINTCRTRHQRAEPLDYETDELLALTAYVAHQARGEPVHVQIDGVAAAYYEAGRKRFYKRVGQLNLSCAQCHEAKAGRRLRGDTISNGVGSGWPAYRLEWQTLGSLHRRLRACSLGVRARQFDYGSQEYLNLELYLAKRAEGLPVEAPGVRR